MSVNTNYQTEEAAIQSEIVMLEELAKDNPIFAAMLNNIIKTLETIKAQIQAEANEATPQAPTEAGSSGSGVPDVCANMAEMMALMSQLQGILGKSTQQRAQNDNKMDTAMVALLQSNVAAAVKEYNKLISSQNDTHWWDIFLKVVEAVVAAIVAVIACVCGQPELAIMVIALCIMAETGGFQAMTKAISSLLQDMGVPKEVADILASVIVILLTIAATILTCGAAAPEAATEVAGEIGETVAGDVSSQVEAEIETEVEEEVTEETSNTASNATDEESTLSKAWRMIKENNPFNKLSKATNLSILTGSQAFTQSGLIDNIVNTLPVSEKEKEKLKLILDTIAEVIAALVSIAAGMGSTASASTVTADSALGRLTAQIKSFAESMPGFMSKLELALFGATLAQGGAQGMLAKSQFDQANIQQELGNNKATSDLMNFLIKTIVSDAQANTKAAGSMLSSHSQANAVSMEEFIKSQQSIAQELAG